MDDNVDDGDDDDDVDDDEYNDTFSEPENTPFMSQYPEIAQEPVQKFLTTTSEIDEQAKSRLSTFGR
ncbi:unnamed protein product [Acanthoscelides obtectus]|uniref:Uncharacterized protein n=1 Tax=Acanthoscelides obtectus TaxID=200917 RepID=A0A9P0LL53_ACAOB|nr:unnamed protein product [Acanthoscelides obtectus]CAK1632196.1 hypothetical protein AOBTE_LOCUS7400 [Acanthoscelides obtectus]